MLASKIDTYYNYDLVKYPNMYNYFCISFFKNQVYDY